MLLSATSCDFLDKEPENKQAESNVDFTKIENMYQPVSGVYGAIRTGGTHWVIWGLSVLRDGDVWSGRVDDQQTLVEMGKYNYDNSFWGLNEMWNQYYGIIKKANAALESLDSYAQNIKSTSDMAKYKSYCGEVRFLRAYAYYRLVQYFGPVTILRTNSQTDMTRSTVEAVNKYILEDLQYAMDNTFKLRPNEMEHFGAVSAYSAEMLAAKVNMNMGNYDKVVTLTDEIINSGKFSLYNDFYELFKIPGKECNESMFEIQLTDFGTGSGDLVDSNCWFCFQGPANDGPISGWGFVGIYKSMRDWAAARGETVRATTSFLLAGSTTPSGDVIRPLQNPTQTDCWNGKAYTPLNELTAGRTDYGVNNNVRVFRYADVLLMNAEAKVRLSKDLGTALTNFNLVRTRAKMTPFTAAQLTVDNIIDERRMEFVCEWGERYNDLVRTGKAESVLGSLGWTKDKTYFPIPFEQISNIPSLANEPKAE